MTNPKSPPPPKKSVQLPAAPAANDNGDPPPRLKPLSHAARCKLFGSFGYVFKPTPTAKERIEVNTAWLSANIVVVPIPHLAHINGGVPVKARLHKLAAPKFLALFDAWRAQGLTSLILTWNGSYVARFKRGKGGGRPQDLSNHSWGTAIDLNAQWNRLGQTPAAVGALGSVRPLVAIANRLGFAWGGDFSTPDGMHFELVRV